MVGGQCWRSQRLRSLHFYFLSLLLFYVHFCYHNWNKHKNIGLYVDLALLPNRLCVMCVPVNGYHWAAFTVPLIKLDPRVVLFAFHLMPIVIFARVTCLCSPHVVMTLKSQEQSFQFIKVCPYFISNRVATHLYTWQFRWSHCCVRQDIQRTYLLQVWSEKWYLSPSKNNCCEQLAPLKTFTNCLSSTKARIKLLLHN